MQQSYSRYSTHLLATVVVLGLCTAFLPARSTAFAADIQPRYTGSSQPDSVLRDILVAEGIDDPAVRLSYQAAVQRLATAVQSDMDDDSPYDRAETLFEFLHRTALKKYTDSSTLHTLLDSSYFNCASATMLYYVLAARYAVPLELYVTRSHMYCVLALPDRQVRIELTDPQDGFDIENDIEEVIDQLVEYKLVTREELERDGYDKIYRDYFNTATRIAPAGLAAVAAYNAGAAFAQEDRYEAAASAYAQAMQIDSTIDFYRASYMLAQITLFSDLKEKEQYTAMETSLYRAAGTLQDSSFALYLTNVTADILNHYTSRPDMAQRASTMLDSLATLLAYNQTALSWLQKQRRSSDYRRALQAHSRGNYRVAFDIMSDLVASDSSFQFRELHAKSAAGVATDLVQHGRGEEGLALLDSLLTVYTDFPVLRELFSSLTITHIIQSGLIKQYGTEEDNLRQARTLLLRAYNQDSTNIYLKQGMAEVYAQLGRAQVLRKKYREAIDLYNEGLTYDPSNEGLKSLIEITRSAWKAPPVPTHTIQSPDVKNVEAKVTFSAAPPTGEEKPTRNMSAVLLYKPRTYLYIEWQGLQANRIHKCECKVLDSKGKELNSAVFYFTPSEDTYISTASLPNDKDYSQAYIQYEVYLEGRKMFERTFRVVK